MTATREWPLPVGGVTVHFIGDLHMMATDTNGRRAKARTDMTGSPLLPPVVAHVQIGDFTDTYVPAYDTAALAWLAGLTNAPRYVMVGNHDMYGRTGDQAATAYGMASKNYVVNLGAITLVVVGPSADQADHCTILLDAATLAWLDATLTATPGPCAIACHAPLDATVVANATDPDAIGSTNPEWHAEPKTEIEAMLAAHSNVVAWIGGHTHTHPRNTGAVIARTFGGHTVACITTSALYYTGTTVEPDDPLMSCYVTFYPSRVDVRYRDHGGATWFRTPAGALVRSITI